MNSNKNLWIIGLSTLFMCFCSGPTRELKNSVNGESKSKSDCPDDTQPVDENKQQYCLNAQHMRHGPYVTFHKEDRIEKQGSYVHGKKHGKWTTFDKKGNKVWEIDYVEGLVHGKWTFFHMDGAKAQEINYQDGKKHGKWTVWSQKGNPLTEVDYEKDLAHGKWMQWDDTKEPIANISYERGQMHGSYWRRDIREKTIRNRERNNKGWTSETHKSQEISVIIETGKYVRGKRQGLWKATDSEGKLLYECQYNNTISCQTEASDPYDDRFDELHVTGQDVDGVRVGNWSWVNDNNTVEGNYDKKGKRHGKWTYQADSQVVREVTFKHGKVIKISFSNTSGDQLGSYKFKKGNGLFELWSPTGEKWEAGRLKDGLRHNEWVTYWEDGKIRSQGSYLEGKKQGVWKEFNQEGIEQEFYTYKNGTLNGKSRWLIWSNIAECNYEDGIKHGNYTEWDEEGLVRAKGSYNRGLPHGKWSIRNETITGEYVDGEPHGVWTIKESGQTLTGALNLGNVCGQWRCEEEDGSAVTGDDCKVEAYFEFGNKEEEWSFIDCKNSSTGFTCPPCQ